MRFLLIFTFCFACAFSHVDGLFIKNIANKIMNSNEKLCSNCKHFIPQHVDYENSPIEGLFSEKEKVLFNDSINIFNNSWGNKVKYYQGKCSKFKYSYFIKDDESESDIEKKDDMYAIYCRLNEQLCGQRGKYFEKDK